LNILEAVAAILEESFKLNRYTESTATQTIRYYIINSDWRIIVNETSIIAWRWIQHGTVFISREFYFADPSCFERLAIALSK